MTELRSITIEIPTAVAQKLAEWHEGTLEHATTLALKLYSGIGNEGYTALQSLAHASDTTTTKALREAIFHAQRTLNAPAAPPTVGRPKINTERDNAIYAAVTQQGKTYSQAATLFNLSLVRVGQIIAQQRAERGETGRQFKAPKQEAAPKPPKPTEEAQPRNPVAYPETPEQIAARAQFKLHTAIGDAMLEMLVGMSAATAAEKYQLDADRTHAAYKAYSALVNAHSPKSAKATSIYAAFTAYEEHGTEPKPEVLSLEDSAEAKPRYVMPALEALKAQQANQPPADTRTAIERNVFDPEFGF
jgi:hypothetical protein